MLWPFLGTASLGILSGIMVGLSVSPIVTTALGAVLGIGGVLITANAKDRSPEEKRYLGITVLAFSLFAFFGIGLGIYGRTHDLLGRDDGRATIVRLGSRPTLEQLAKVSQTNEPGAVAALLRRAAADGYSITLTSADLDRLIALNLNAKGWVELLEPERTAAAPSPTRASTDLRALRFGETECPR